MKKCKILSKSGELVFLCNKEKANWYLVRELASKVSDNPLTIQLRFKPKKLETA